MPRCKVCDSTKIRKIVRTGPARSGPTERIDPKTRKKQLAPCDGPADYFCRKHNPDNQ